MPVWLEFPLPTEVYPFLQLGLLREPDRTEYYSSQPYSSFSLFYFLEIKYIRFQTDSYKLKFQPEVL